MPNFFDQFDQPQARVAPQPATPNFFDQFDEPETPAQQPLQTPERWRLEDKLKRELASADEAGKDLERTETAVGIARPFLRGAVDLADGALALPKLAASVPVAGLNLAGANLRLPATYSLKELGSDGGKSLAPRNDSERFASAVTQGVGGAVGGIGLGSLAAGAGGTAGAIGSSLAAQPALQAVQSVTSAVGSEGARKLGAGPIGQTVGGILGALTPGAAVGTAQKIGSGLNRTPEAQRLLDAGVDLTPGQLNPKGFVNQLEETVQSVGFVGPVIRGARDNAKSTFQRAAAQQGAAPGATVNQAGAAEMLDEAYQSFRPLYDQAKGFPAQPLILNTSGPNVPLSQAFRNSTQSNSVLATDEQRKNVAKFLEQQLTRRPTTSDDLLDIRSTIRDKARSLRSQNRSDEAELFDDADAAVTQALDSQLPPDALSALRRADAKYGDYKTVEKAVYSGSTKADEFTPFDLSKAVKQSNRGESLGSYARGGGGPVRQLADDATSSLETRAPANGSRLLALPAATVAGPFILGAAGTQSGRRLAQGKTDFQRTLAQALQQSGLKGGAGARAGATQEAIEALTDQERLALALQEATQRRKERR